MKLQNKNAIKLESAKQRCDEAPKKLVKLQNER